MEDYSDLLDQIPTGLELHNLVGDHKKTRQIDTAKAETHQHTIEFLKVCKDAVLEMKKDYQLVSSPVNLKAYHVTYTIDDQIKTVTLNEVINGFVIESGMRSPVTQCHKYGLLTPLAVVTESLREKGLAVIYQIDKGVIIIKVN
jgi:hypothetical protein